MAWAQRVGLVPTERAAAVGRQRIAWLAARCFPFGDAAAVDLVAAWLTFHCIFDDVVENLEAARLDHVLGDVAAAFHGDAAATGDDPASCAAADLRAQVHAHLDDAQRDRFLATVDRLFASFRVEARLRAGEELDSLESLLTFRETNVGVEPLLALVDPIHSGRPDGMERPFAADLERRVCRLGAVANDLLTYDDERRTGASISAVAWVARHEDADWDTAHARVTHLHDDAMADFAADTDALLSTALPAPSRRHVETLRAFVRGHLDWAAVSTRHQD